MLINKNIRTVAPIQILKKRQKYFLNVLNFWSVCAICNSKFFRIFFKRQKYDYFFVLTFMIFLQMIFIRV